MRGRGKLPWTVSARPPPQQVAALHSVLAVEVPREGEGAEPALLLLQRGTGRPPRTEVVKTAANTPWRRAAPVPPELPRPLPPSTAAVPAGAAVNAETGGGGEEGAPEQGAT
eukprot:13113196-Alexandrium_andersonii.AAC.1